ncbi:hypothetical protein C8R47DRAFT_143300 [Mycena vitilis]|nr:hypothetical protein C8R47DRAFT_143300 [Mycena vitilis]
MRERTQEVRREMEGQERRNDADRAAPTATSGIPASNVISRTTTHSARPPPIHSLHSEKQHKAPVGLIVGVAIAILLFIASLFLFIHHARERAAFAGPGKTLGSAAAVTPYPRPSIAKESGGAYAGHDDKPWSTPSERDAVELGAYPPPQPPPASHERTGSAGSWATPFAGVGAGGRAEPGANSSPAARQAYLATKLRAAQGVLERAGTVRFFFHMAFYVSGVSA